jgi:hypothetical protein
MSWIRHPKDFGSGCLFGAFGAAAVGLGASYPVGTAARMGPGYFPRALGLMLLAFAAVLIVKSLRTQGSRIAIGDLKPVLVVLASVLLFGLAVMPLGLVLATIVLIMVSSAASHEFRWKEALVASLVLAAFVTVAFGYGLKLQLPILPPFLTR